MSAGAATPVIAVQAKLRAAHHVKLEGAEPHCAES